MSRVDIPVPTRMAALPRNKADYVVPWFVAWVDGHPDFRVIKPNAIPDALRFKSCWLCGNHIGSRATFVIGPMCAINRVSAEPPSHPECAEYAARVCPFLTTPAMVRRDHALPEHTDPAGHMLRRNPGVALCWTSKTWSPFDPDGSGRGLLFDVGDPTATTWWAEGRPATRDEILASIDSGLPVLRDMAKEDGPVAVVELDRMVERGLALVPEA